MNPFDPTNPLHQEAKLIREMAVKSIAAGRLSPDALKEVNRPEGFSFDQYTPMVMQNDPGKFGTPSNSPGADVWRSLARERIAGAESHVGLAYDDAAKGAKARSVGYGFNLSQPWVRNGIKTTLGWSDADVAALTAGKKQMTVTDSDKVLGAFIDAMNYEVSANTRGMALSAPARAALVDLTYNSGSPALKARGVFDKLRQGDLRGVMAAIATWDPPTNIKTGKPLTHVQQRRKAAARDIAGESWDQFKGMFS